MIKNICKVKDHWHYTGKHRGAAQSISNLRYSIPKQIPILFHNGSKHYYHFIGKELADELEAQFTCLGKNTKKNTEITFSVPIKKYKDCECYLEYTNVKDDLTVYKFLCCNGNYQKTFDEDLK